MDFIDKVPPHSIEAEAAVLGSMLSDKDTIPIVFSILTENDFYSDRNRKIFLAIKKILEKGATPDLVTLINELKRENVFEEIGGTYITSLFDFVSTSANVEHYAKIVKEKSILRGLIQASYETIEEAYNSPDEISKLLDKAQSRIFSLALHGDIRGPIKISHLLDPALERLQVLFKEKKPVTGIPTGFVDLDEKITGLQPSQFIIVAGRPGMGKTSFCLNILANVGIRYGYPVAFFSLEMSKEELLFRLLCSEARVDSHVIRKGRFDREVHRKLTNVAAKLREAPIFIDDTPDLSILDLRLRARKLSYELRPEKELKLVMVDFIQLLRGVGKYESKQQEIADISKGLKNLSKELNVPVVAISQLSRKPEEREKERRKPQLSDLRESGALEQDADVVLFIFREGLYLHTDDPEVRQSAEIIIAKQRHGPLGTVKMVFLEGSTRFEEKAFEK